MIKGKIREFIQKMEQKRTRKKMLKEREKRRSGKYGQVTLKHSHRGIVSCMLAGIVLFLLALLFSVSYVSKGDVSIFVGFIGLAALWTSLTGVLRGLDGLKERDKKYGACRIGVALNGFFSFILILLFIRGFM